MNDEVAPRPVREDDDLSMLEELTQDPEKTGEFEWFGGLIPGPGGDAGTRTG